jgi:streptogramin lyase
VIGSGPLPTPTPIVPSVTNEFAVATANSQPGGITTGRDGFLYFTEQNAGNIGQITTGGVLVELSISAKGGTAGNNGIGITSGPDFNLWFTEQGAAPGIAQMLLGSHTVTEFHIPGSTPTYIVSGPVQNTLVFSDPGQNKIGQITTSGTVTENSIPTANAGPMGLAVGPDQKVYFAENTASKIGIWDPVGNTFSEIPTLTANAGPTTVVLGNDGALWFTENKVAKLGRLTTSGVMTEYSLAPATSATALIWGVDNNIYFADPAQDKVGQFVPTATSNAVNEFAIPTSNATPGQFALGPDFRIYFTETQGNKIGQFNY